VDTRKTVNTLYARVGEMFEENLLDVGNTVFGVENII
jgi:hypothetical protein